MPQARSLRLAHLCPYGDDSIVVSECKELAIIGPATAADLGRNLVFGHRLQLWRPQPWERERTWGKRGRNHLLIFIYPEPNGILLNPQRHILYYVRYSVFESPLWLGGVEGFLLPSYQRGLRSLYFYQSSETTHTSVA